MHSKSDNNASPGRHGPDSSVRYVTVAPALAGQRLDNFLLRILGRLPRSAVYRMIRRGEVRVNRGRKAAHYRVRAGDELRLPPLWGTEAQAPQASGASTAEDLPKGFDALASRVLYEDEQLLILDKPSGLAVHGGSGISLGLIEGLRQLREEPELELVHRIDRDTSGCIAVARTRAALRIAQAQFRAHQVRKRYQLLVDGSWHKAHLRLDLPLHRWLTRSGERRVRVDRRAGKTARTDFERLRQGATLSWIQASPLTGRTHQLRVHAAQLGHPILGDSKYGSDQQQTRWAALGVTRLCLHAERLRLPMEDKLVDVRAPVPVLFERLWRSHG